MGAWGKRGRTKPGRGGILRPHLRARLVILQDDATGAGASDRELAQRAGVTPEVIHGAKRNMRYQGHIRKQTKLALVRRPTKGLNLF